MLITDPMILDQLNSLSVQLGTAIYNKSLECICIRCKVNRKSKMMNILFLSRYLEWLGWISENSLSKIDVCT